jgi:ABC-type dipeptide/oligopeptide/nickel transport system permease subunit
VLSALAFVFALGSSNSWVSGLLLPWITSPLPESIRHAVIALWPRLVGDVHDAVVAVGIASTATIGLGWLLALIARVKAWPRTAIVDTILSGPFATFVLLLAAMDTQSRTWFWPSLAFALQGGAKIRDLANQLRNSPPMLASKVAGSSTLRRWFTHAVPDLANELCAWAIESLGTALLWIVLIHSLVPAGTASLGNALAAARNTALTDPSIVLQTTLTTAIAVLCFWRLSRVLRAAPH